MESVTVSVRNLIEFILRTGDIDNRHIGKSSDDRMQEGSRIHRMIQKKGGPEYRAEVPLSYIHEADGYLLKVEGRADGIIENSTGVTIDEIKGTYRDLNRMKGPVPMHLAQAKCYAFMYAYEQNLSAVTIRMTYCNLENEELRFFTEEYAFRTLELWFKRLIKDYLKWSDFTVSWKSERTRSIKNLEFPFEYRPGQKDLAGYVYSTVVRKKKLFIEAPTGVGKTITTLFPAIKAVGEGEAERIFYFTAKTITRTVASDTLDILRDKALRMKSVIITAKDKICVLPTPECNPASCERAHGHFNRVNDCMYDMLLNEDIYSREVIEKYAEKYTVCPFELCLDMSLFCDIVICDYNYLFDPHVYLKRFFAAGSPANSLFLIDEAHNLLDRGRDMYSAVLVKENVLKFKRELKADSESEKPLIPQYYSNRIIKSTEAVNKEMLSLKRIGNPGVTVYEDTSELSPLIMKLDRLSGVISGFLEDEEGGGELRKTILEFYFELSHFLLIRDRVDENYIAYTMLDSNDRFSVKLFCVNPALQLKECMDKGVSTTLFSATLLPIQYFKKLLGGTKDDYEIYAHSIFDPSRKGLFIANDVTTRYTSRSPENYRRIARHIYEVVSCRRGNYMVFFPSHAFAATVREVYEEEFLNDDVTFVLQKESMIEEEREEFLAQFSEDGPGNILAFCALGGIFSEGIDLKGESLIGAIIVGNGLPLVCAEREILKDFFDRTEDSGFDYAYRFPGMNKVLQASGRVIRTLEDVGVVVLLENRFLQPASLRLFPREWEEYKVVNVGNVAENVKAFWKKFDEET